VRERLHGLATASAPVEAAFATASGWDMDDLLR
jgi:hypothetical protein